MRFLRCPGLRPTACALPKAHGCDLHLRPHRSPRGRSPASEARSAATRDPPRFLESTPSLREATPAPGTYVAVLSYEPRVYADIAPTSDTEPPPIVVHVAELRGLVESQAGKRLTIQPLVVTSEKFPVPAGLARLWIAGPEENGVPSWKYWAEVRVATPLLFGASMELDLLDEVVPVDAKPPARPALEKGASVRVQWEWE